MSEMKFMTLAAQQYYDEKIKAHIAEEDAKLLDKIETHVYSWNDLQDRPFYYREEILETIAENITVDAGSIYLNLPEDYRYYFWSDKAGQEYKVILNGETYYATLVDYTSSPPKCVLGNTAMYMSGEPDTGHPFAIIRDQTNNYLKTTDDSIERTVSIYHVNRQLKQLDEKFIPDTIARISDIPVDTVTNSELHSIAKSGNWDDLENKPFYENIKKSKIFYPHQEVAVGQNEITMTTNIMVSAGLTEGDYVVIFDETKYSIKTTLAAVKNWNSSAVILGNLSLLGDHLKDESLMVDNGLPFAILFNRGDRNSYFYSTDNTIPHTIEVYTVDVQIKPLDEKFIPDTIARISDIENIDLTPYETKTDAAAKLDEAKAFASGEDAKVQGTVDTLSGKVTTLIGEDTNKSIRTIANEELAKQLVAEGAKESLDTLTEIAAWIQSHPDDASAMNKAINDLEALVGALPDGVAATTIIGYVQEVVAANKALIDANTEAIDGLATVATTGSWDDLEDKPFGEDAGIVIEPDFNAFEETIGFINDLEHVKVSDILPTVEQITAANGTWHCDVCQENGGCSFEISIQEEDVISVGVIGGCGCEDIGFFIVYNDNVSGEFYTGVTYEFPESGLYMTRDADALVDKIIINSTVKTIDEKFIPDTIARTEDIITPVQSDWNEFNENSLSYIKNKTHYEINQPIIYFSGDNANKQYLFDYVSEEPLYFTFEDNTTIKVDCVEVIKEDIYPNRWYRTDNFEVNIGYESLIFVRKTPNNMKITKIASGTKTQTILKQLDSKFIPSDILRYDGIPQSDWLEDFSESKSYIQNKPFYEGTKYLLQDQTVFNCSEIHSNYYPYYTDNNNYIYTALEMGKTYTIHYVKDFGEWKDRDTITLIAQDAGGNIAIGNLSIFNNDTHNYEDTGEEFVILWLINNDYGIICTKEPKEIEIGSIYTNEVKQLDDKFISDNIARISDFTEVSNEEIDAMFA